MPDPNAPAPEQKKMIDRLCIKFRSAGYEEIKALCISLGWDEAKAKEALAKKQAESDSGKKGPPANMVNPGGDDDSDDSEEECDIDFDDLAPVTIDYDAKYAAENAAAGKTGLNAANAAKEAEGGADADDGVPPGTSLLDAFLDKAKPLQYNVLVVDDEEDVRKVTKLCLKSMKYKNTPVKVTEAASKAEAVKLLENNYGHPYVCAIVDVVMESDHAGLELVTHIRETLGNNSMSIFLRTGQPGQAPEREVMEKLGIDGYVLKTELTDDKLYTMTLASIKSTLRAWPYENAIGQLGLFRFGTYEKNAFMAQVDMAYKLAEKLADKPSFASGHYFYCLGKTYSSGSGGMICDKTRLQHLALAPQETSGPIEYRAYKTTHSLYSKVSGTCWMGQVIEFTPEWISTWITFFQIFDHFIMQTKSF